MLTLHKLKALKMNIRNITPRIHYVGVNDRTTSKFENLWPLPFGVSYNSYLVAGSEKVALIDAVEVAFLPALIEKVKSFGAPAIDYLVVNHMEPDHSGAIPEILSIFPDLKIIGNKITKGMLQGFYSVPDSRILEIADGQEISLGGLTLRFITTPLVHWPETMMTYVPEEEVIFTGDAFGCFGALNGGVVDSEMDTDFYIPEMYRYYSNIVGKYGKPVQMALKKTADLKVKYICTTHGPVWCDRKKEVVDIYRRLSRYEGEEGVTIVYGSMYGNTAALAEVIASRLSERGVKTIRIHNVSKSPMSFVISDAFRYKGLIIGAPTYSGHIFPPIGEFLTAMEVREVKNKVMAAFGSFTWASAACKYMQECMVRMNADPVSTLDMKQAPSVNDVESARALADKVADALQA